MKKLVILTAGLAILAFGCASAGKKADTVEIIRPGANEAFVYFLNMEIEGYDVTKDEKGLPYAKITARETTFRGRVVIIHSGVAFLAANVAFTFRPEQGKKYFFVGTAQNMTWGISVYENVYDPANKETSKIAFISFINQPSFQTIQVGGK